MMGGEAKDEECTGGDTPKFIYGRGRREVRHSSRFHDASLTGPHFDRPRFENIARFPALGHDVTRE